MRCGQHGCSCTTCEDCGNSYERCICNLKNETTDFLNTDSYENETHLAKAIRLLQDWMDVS